MHILISVYMQETNPIISLVLFLMVFFLYLHVTAQWKKSEDMEIYEADYVNYTQFQEICDVRQPVLFQLPSTASPFFNRIRISQFQKYQVFDVFVKNCTDYHTLPADTSIEVVSLPLHSATALLEKDTNAKYISEHNQSFLEDSGLASIYTTLNAYLRPFATVYSKYDLVFGSAGAHTPFQYHTYSRLYLATTTGKIRVKLAPWKTHKHVYPHKDYDLYEFRSPINIWSPAAKYADNIQYVQCLEVDVIEGNVLFIPPFWWYSIQFSSDTSTTVATFAYATAMNAVANSYDWGMYMMRVKGWGAEPNLVKPELGNEIGIPAPPSVSNSKPELIQTQPDETIVEMSETPSKQPPAPIITNCGVYNP